jgi:hypothetical protein
MVESSEACSNDIHEQEGKVSLIFAGKRYVAAYKVLAGELTVRSPFGLLEMRLSSNEVAATSVARVLLRLAAIEHHRTVRGTDPPKM